MRHFIAILGLSIFSMAGFAAGDQNQSEEQGASSTTQGTEQTEQALDVGQVAVMLKQVVSGIEGVEKVTQKYEKAVAFFKSNSKAKQAAEDAKKLIAELKADTTTLTFVLLQMVDKDKSDEDKAALKTQTKAVLERVQWNFVALASLTDDVVLAYVPEKWKGHVLKLLNTVTLLLENLKSKFLPEGAGDGEIPDLDDIADGDDFDLDLDDEGEAGEL